ncbi:MAG: Tat pathway signal sequence [Coriobacteriales bacterium]|jgi:hypothetical protein|nr:Tat pathway signal sequence [Coriobacteriales bacterium]
MANNFSFDDFLRQLGGMGMSNEESDNDSGSKSDTSENGKSSKHGSGGFGGFGNGSFGGGTGKGQAKWTPSAAERTERARRLFKRLLIGICIAIIPVLLVAYWWFHPPINIHSMDCWMFVIVLILLPAWFILRFRSQFHGRTNTSKPTNTGKAKLFRRLSWLPVAVLLVCIGGALAGATFFPGNAERYATVLETQSSDFSTDIKEVNYNEIPVIDRASATLLGNRVMGAIPEFVSQFEISPLYSQINYQGHPVRVSPLVYADFFKWFNNRDNGLPAYVLVDMTTQDAQIVRLNKPMYYSESEPFERNIARHVQLSFPFYMFDQISFEIDDEGNPWWVCPVQTRTIGLFGGTDIKRVVLVDANSGACTDLPVSDTPQWVDRVYPAELLIEQYNWSGAYSAGWINSWLGQSGVVQTTPGTASQLGYNYIAKDDDVWVYTGVTSAVADNSIVGFVLINQRTAESHFYSIAGATEESAMYSAEGQVQHLRYTSTFPLLLNINSQPTYFMALKDAAGLVKQYAMLDIQRYQNVAVGDTVADCQRAYQALLVTNGVEMPEADAPATNTVTGRVVRIATAVIDGNSHFYLSLDTSVSAVGEVGASGAGATDVTGAGSSNGLSTSLDGTEAVATDERIFDCALPGLLDVLTVSVGDLVTITYVEKNPEQEVLGSASGNDYGSDSDDGSNSDAGTGSNAASAAGAASATSVANGANGANKATRVYVVEKLVKL